MGKGSIPDYDDPEQFTGGIMEIDEGKCIRCGTCRYPCPIGTINFPAKKNGEKQEMPRFEEIFPGVSLCMACGDCAAACKQGAITPKRGFRVQFPYFYSHGRQSKEFAYPRKY